MQIGSKKVAKIKSEIFWGGVCNTKLIPCDFCGKKSHYGISFICFNLAFSCPRCGQGMGLLDYKHVRYLANCYKKGLPPTLNSSNLKDIKYQKASY